MMTTDRGHDPIVRHSDGLHFALLFFLSKKKNFEKKKQFQRDILSLRRILDDSAVRARALFFSLRSNGAVRAGRRPISWRNEHVFFGDGGGAEALCARVMNVIYIHIDYKYTVVGIYTYIKLYTDRQPWS